MVEPGKWTLVFSGKSVFQYEASAKLAEVPLTLEEASDSAELVTIQVTDKDGTGIIEIVWGKMRLSASFKPAEAPSRKTRSIRESGPPHPARPG